MEKIEIILPLKINSKLSLNKLYSCHCHWSVRERKAKEVHKKVKLQLISDKVRKRLFDTKISIEFFWNSRLDLDNKMTIENIYQKLPTIFGEVKELKL